jgi:chromosomal replication initiation ATPase DnaA
MTFMFPYAGSPDGVSAAYRFSKKPGEKRLRAKLIPSTAAERMAAISPPFGGRVTVNLVVVICCAYYGVSPRRVMGFRRHSEVMAARQMAMFIAKSVAKKSLSEIGRAMRRHHTTVLSGYRKISAARETNEETRRAVDAITAAIMPMAIPEQVDAILAEIAGGAA